MTFGALCLAALLTATLSGIIGMGGGVTLLGVMALLLPGAVVVPLHGAVQLASNGTRALAFVRHVRWPLVAAFAPALAVGIAGASLLYAGALATDSFRFFRPIIGAYVLFFLVWRRKAPALRSPPLYSYALLGLGTGFAALFVGATGPLLAPFFLRDDLEKEQVIGTKAACQILVHLAKFPAFFAVGFDYRPHLPLLAALVACVVVGTLLGKRVLARLASETFVRLFEGVLGLLGTWLIVQFGLDLAGVW